MGIDDDPDPYASSAERNSPVMFMYIDFDLPIIRVNRCVPPAPGIIPKLISGCPN